MDNGLPPPSLQVPPPALTPTVYQSRAPQKTVPMRKKLTLGSWLAISFLVGTSIIVILYFWGEAITLRPS